MTRWTWAAVVMLTAAIAVTAGFAVRIGLLEWPALAWACAAATPPFGCGIYLGLAAVLRFGTIGMAGLALGLLALLGGGPRTTLAAVAVGAAGLGLYAPELAAGGLLLGLLRVLRLANGGGTAASAQQYRPGEQG